MTVNDASTPRADLAPGIPSSRLVQLTFALGVLSTAIHYWHNFAHAEHYPPVLFFPTAFAYRVGILVFWPTLTAWGAWAVLRWSRGNPRSALVPLAAWSLLGLTSPGHFLGGVPDIPAYAMFTISTDFAVGAVMLVLVAQACTELRRRATPEPGRPAPTT